MHVTIARHGVPSDPQTHLSPLQTALLSHPAPVRIADAPTGTGKSYAFQRAMIDQQARILFIVPTRRLAQNLLRSLLEGLEAIGWDEKKRQSKVTLWSGDATKTLLDEGVREIGARRIREIYELDTTRRGGEMIVSVPEVVSGILLRWHSKKGQSDAGIFDFLTCFDHIVFDEFHTIQARGFGLAAVFAKLAAEYPGARAKVSFLSATPLDIQPVLADLNVPKDQVVWLKEEVSETGRAIHGDVILQCEEDSLIRVLEKYLSVVQSELAQQRQIVVIYNELRDLQLDIPQLERWVEKVGINPQECLLINSIDDSRPEVKESGRFAVGRRQPPEKFKILIATSSVEIGVTFAANVLFMEPGFEALNFLQRYGRAARGDFKGHVIVRWDKKLAEKHPWLRELLTWVTQRDGQIASIQELTAELSKQVMRDFDPSCLTEAKYFGQLPRRATFIAGLYWNVLSEHPSNEKTRGQHLQIYAPWQARRIKELLAKVRQMERSPHFARSVKKWCQRFEAEARILRDIGQSIRVINEQGEIRDVQEIWLRRNTNILDQGQWRLGEDGKEEIRYQGSWNSHLLEERRYEPNQMTVLFPHTQLSEMILLNAEFVKEWCRKLRNSRGPASMAWTLHKESMEAAEELVQLTGLVVSDEEETNLSGQTGVL